MGKVGLGPAGQVHSCPWSRRTSSASAARNSPIAAYLGGGKELADAMVEYAEAYADVNEQDHAGFAAAVAEGRLPAAPPE